jgi:type II secretory pathway pseudopilin PulG
MSNQHFNTQYDFLFVGKDEGSFVENYAYDLGEGGEQGGKVFICLEIAQNNQDPDRIGEVIFDSLRRVFFADSEVDGYERFEESLKQVNHALEEYRQERGSEWLGKLNVIIAAVVGDQLYLTQSGEAEAYLIRKRFVTTISDDLSDPESKDVFTNIASGDLEAGDFILLSTTRLLRYVSKNDLSRNIGGGLQHSVLAVRDFLHGEVISKVGLIAIEGGQVAALAKDDLPETEPVAHSREEGYQEMGTTKSRETLDLRAMSDKLNLKGVKNFLGTSVSGIRRKMNELASEDRVERRGRSSNPWSFSNWGKDKILVAIIVLVLILTMGVWWLRSKADEDARVQMLANDLVQIREQINSAVTTGQFDKDRAGEMLNDAEQKAIGVLNSGYHKDKARELLDTILDTRDKMDGVMHPEMQLMADLSQKRSNVNALGLVKLKDKLYAYEYNALYPVALDRVEDPLTIDDNETVVSAVNYDDRGSILFFTASGKVKEYLDDRMSFLQTSDSAFKPGKVLQAYSNKIYVLDSEGNQIWRYTRRRDQFDAAQPYVNGVDLSSAVDLAIDGNIYVLGADGYITKLFQGNKQDFPIKKQPVKALVNPTRIFTEADMNQIFVMEPSENRVLVYNKDDRSGGAIYTGQYIFDELEDIKDFHVDKNTNTMYVLTATAIYRTAL